MSVLQKKHPLKTLNSNRLLAAYGSLSLRPNTGKRKSAVEMLQETKAFYVKSERVLDRKQEMPHADHLQVSPTPLCRPPWLRQYSEPPTPPPTPPRPAALPPRAAPDKGRTTPEKPPPLPLRSPGCGGKTPPSRTKTPPGGSARAGGGSGCRPERARAAEPAAAARHRSGDSVQARLRQLLTPAPREPADAGRHKSLPDISGDSVDGRGRGSGRGSGDGRGSGRGSGDGVDASSASADSGGVSLAGRQSRSEARSRGRATSDYVSRSPVSALTPSEGRLEAMTDDGRLRLGAPGDEPDPDPWPHRPVTRSKSDVSHKYCRGGGGGGAALGLWTPEPPPPLPARGVRRASRGSRGSAELGRFFDQLGMDGERFGRVARAPSDHWSPVETPSFWDGLSGSSRGRRNSAASEASSAGRRRPPEAAGGLRASLLPPAAAEPSIVEKNARIVKWLFHCRRAQQEWGLGVT